MTELQLILLMDGALANMPDYDLGDDNYSDPSDPLARFKPKKKPASMSEIQNFFGGHSDIISEL